MKLFDKAYNQILNEIPYVDYINKFDLEIENKQDVEKFLYFLSEILEGNLKQDKYNNKIQLTTDNDKKFFITSVLNDLIIDKWVKKQAPDDQNKIKEFFKTAIVKFSKTKPRSQYY